MKQNVEKKNQLIKITALMLGLAVFGTSFDAFLHLSRGRETLFSLPHLFIYGGTFGAMFVVWRLYAAYGQKSWRAIFGSLAMVVLAGVLDEIWHQFKGRESIESLSILWSPPHMVLFISAMCSVFCFIRVLREEDNRATWQLGPVFWGLLLNLIIIFVGPMMPASPQHILGSAGMGIIMACVVFIFLFCARTFPSYGGVVVTAMTFALLLTVIYDANLYISAGKNFLHVPAWLNIMVYFFGSLAVESTPKFKFATRGIMAGIVCGSLFFILSRWLVPGADYSGPEIIVGILTSTFGGLAAGLIHQYGILKV